MISTRFFSRYIEAFLNTSGTIQLDDMPGDKDSNVNLHQVKFLVEKKYSSILLSL